MRRLIAMLFIAFGFLAGTGGVAFAQEGAGNAENVSVLVGESEWLFELPPLIAGPIIGFFVPALTALITKIVWPGWIKGLVMTVLAALAAALAQATTEGGGAVISQATVIAFLTTWATAAAAWWNIWRPSLDGAVARLTRKLQAIGSAPPAA